MKHDEPSQTLAINGLASVTMALQGDDAPGRDEENRRGMIRAVTAGAKARACGIALNNKFSGRGGVWVSRPLSCAKLLFLQEPALAYRAPANALHPSIPPS
jgi:hypothetical protein